ncbi:pre-peptidase C-terminal domain-containing protein [Limnoraphis robusta]|uniref:Pre-peptidase C-terminal domain-containing protein n=1 Tax=Limnoraphis robusta CCNP1315 TaxID=3110306 RepID=A0ABU5U1M1_9CYAN|nr:pre-peptidase C-terminal domain-containing protein [Limnoraphis robusta]MEA5495798.1 pre-peptidase C-terminal domain-containing protein [Limnoraphis robusta BA-68 BA1]MEA5521094.1 pre-peptidase C-terminal domain-containing protein [Limnoraphis robusta CCNP1315]MEA5543461.1 pre-peptidase C-terminal domain-containing protein [Limnoraphis robusta CCNP1324]
MEIFGTASTEALWGTESPDNIFGMEGIDTINALAGDDVIFGNQDGDWIDCGDGFDTVYGGKDDDFIRGMLGGDYLRGDLGNDEVYGGDGDDILFGGKFNDLLSGEVGNDSLYGDLGSDTVTGGAGSDSFFLRENGEGTDLITDYQQGIDVLVLPDTLTFDDLSIEPGNGNQTLITITSTGEELAILDDVSSSNITAEDFGGVTSSTNQSSTSLSNATDLGILDGTQTESDAVEDSSPIDFYRFTLDTPKDLELKLDGLGNDADLYLIEDVNGNNLFDNALDSSETIASSSNGGVEADSINFTQLAAGTYFVGVFQFDGETNYDLTLTATAFTPRSDEAGNTQGTSLDIGVLQAEETFTDFVGDSDSDDYYKFTLNRVSDFNLSLENLSSDADVELIDSTGNVIDFSTNALNDSETIQSSALPAGDYYLRVYPFSGDTDYDLIISADPVTVIPSDAAGNDTTEANNIGVLAGEQTFNDFVGDVDQDDYYQFTLDQNADFQLTLDQLNVNADVELLDDRGNVIKSSANADSQSETITESLNSGTYFVHVLPKDGDTNYRLSLSAQEQLPPPEPGNTLSNPLEESSPQFSKNGSVNGEKPDNFVQFSVNESGVFTAQLSGLSADADVRLIRDFNNDGQINPVEDLNGNQFIDDNEIEVLAWLPERNTNSESIRAFLEPGTYYLQVNSVDERATNYAVNTTFNASATDPLAFDIQFNYQDGTGGLSSEFRTGLEQAARTWERIIPYSSFAGSHTLIIEVYAENLGEGTLASATYGTKSNDGSYSFREGQEIQKDLNGNQMPMIGGVTISTNPDIQSYFKNDSQAVPRTMIHEFGHVLGLVGGFDNITQYDDLKDSRKFFNKQKDTEYKTNTYAGIAYGELTGSNSPLGIPIETSTGSIGSDYSHWEEATFDTEIMTYQDEINQPRPISQFTIASLRDSGWNVNYGAAEPFTV